MRPLLWIVLLFFGSSGHAARILAILPFPGKSHHVYFSAILKVLAQRGHEVVEYSTFAPKTPIPNYSHVEIQITVGREFGGDTFEDFLNTLPAFQSIFGLKIRRIWQMTYAICEQTLKHEKVQRLIKSNEHFDLVITESTFGQESMLIFGHIFSAPTVTVDSFLPWTILNRESGNSLSLASVPDFTSFVFENSLMTLRDRFLNSFSVLLSLFCYYYSHIPIQDGIIRKNIDDSLVSIPPLADMVANVSLYLTNSHPTSVNYIQPYTSKIVPIGGIHSFNTNAFLSQEMQLFLEGASDGVIYFSFGTVVPTHLMPEEILQIFVRVFKKLHQRIIWKIDLENVIGLPSNVMITKWAPQPYILEHPKCQLFITHGGLFGHHEAMYAGVPTVGIPFFADQMYNIQFQVHRGTGIRLDFENLSEESLYSAITTVLTTPKYKKNAEKLSRIYRDRPMSPENLTVFWVEYVLRHRGAHHLKPAAAALRWYQLAQIDVLAAVITGLILLVTVLFIVVRMLFSFCNKKKHQNNFNSKKRKRC